MLLHVMDDVELLDEEEPEEIEQEPDAED